MNKSRTPLGRQLVSGSVLMFTAAGLPGAGSSAPLSAQDRWAGYNNRRELSGHTFMPAQVNGDPFITSYVRSGTGAGVSAGLQVPIRDSDGNVLAVLDGDLVFLLLEFEYQQSIGSWLALRAGGSAAARVGANEESILAQGVNALYGYNMGGTVKILKLDRVMLSAVADYRSNQIYDFNLFSFLQSVIDNGFDPEGDNGLLESGPSTLFTAGLRVAYTPWRWLGLTALADGGSGTLSLFADDDNRGVGAWGATIGADLGAITSVPIGLQWSFKWSNFNDKSADMLDWQWDSGFTIGYTGQKDFFVGLKSGFGRIGLNDKIAGTDQTSLDAETIQLLLRYYF